MEWNRRKSTRCVWATLVVATFVLCVSFVFINLNLGTNYSVISEKSPDHLPHSEKLSEGECIPVCDSEGCVLLSKTLLDHLQPTSNPCDNFNKFTCGRFTESFPDLGGSWVLRLSKQIRIKFKNVLESLEPSPASASEKMKIVYETCTKTDSETGAVATLLEILGKFGITNWPYLSSEFKFENTTFAKVIANLLLHNENGFVALSREDEPKQLEIPYFLKVTSGEQGDPMLATSSEARKLQIDHILKYFNFDSETITKIQDENEVMRRGIEHLKMESQKISSTSMYEDLHVNCSGDEGNDWVELCKVTNFFLDIGNLNEEVSNQYVSIGSGEIYFVRNIFPLVRNFSDRAVANFLAIEVFLNHLNELNLYFRLANQKGANEGAKLFGMVSPIDRWQSCVDWISKGMTYALMYEYGKKEFTIDMLTELSNITDALIHEVADYYFQQEWVPESVRRVKTEALRNSKLNSPSMKYFPAETTVNEFYDRFKPKYGNFLNNVMEFRRFKKVESMRGKIDRSLLEKNIFKTDAFGGGGSIEIGLTLLQPPYFSTKLQRIFNLVSLGFVIAHEIGHSMFDGREYSLEPFQRNVMCITDQVSQYQFELLGKNLIGRQYMWEELADSVALSVTDKIIERYLSEGVESFLPGLPFPTKQWLYINSAVVFCSASWKRKEELYSEGTHPPDDVRLYQRVRNSKLFPEAFDCPVGSFMNPADKCQILTESRSQ